MKSTFIILLMLCLYDNSKAQSPNWTNIKSNIEPYVANTSEYSTPFIQPHNNLGWEDGVFISRDGLHMYAFYLPADLIKFVDYLSNNPNCPPITPYLRGPLLGIDTITNPWNCSSILHSDIIYAHRSDTSLPFTWQASNLANAVEWEAAPQVLYKQDGSVDIIVYNMSNGNDVEIYWIRDTVNNPNGPGVLMPSPVNEVNFQENNPHIERINDTTLILLLNDIEDAEVADIYYTMSYDDGITWTSKTPLSSVNTPNQDIQPHLWSDGLSWWLYFASTDTADTYNRTSIFRMKQMIPGDFNSWGNRELVIGPGTVTDGSGFVVSLGEPTLTAWGDISFVVAVQASGTSDTTDLFELDPWYLPRRNPILSTSSLTHDITPSIYPNPASDRINIKNIKGEFTYTITDYFGRLIVTKKTSKHSLNISGLNSGLYFFTISNKKNYKTIKLIIK